MRGRDFLSKERFVNGLKSLGKLRVKTSHSSMITMSALVLILFIAFTVRLLPIRWEIQTGSMHLSEFDPYFQYRFTEYMLKNGFISWVWPEQWVDTQRWYPNGYNVARLGYPGLPFTAAFFYSIVSALGINIRLMDFCAIFPPIMGMIACLVIYFLGKDVGGKPVGLFGALFLALNPSYIQRTSLGFFDDEATGIFSLLLFIFLFLRAIEEDRPVSSTVKYAVASGLTLGFFCSGWGAAYYPIAITTLFVFSLILLKRYSKHLLLSYSLTFGLGLFMAINVPKLSSNYLTGIAVLPVAGVFALLCLREIFRTISSAKSKTIVVLVFLALAIGGFAVLWQLGYMRGIGTKFFSVINPFAREAIPLVESVAEHRVSAWGSIYYDLGIGIIFFAISLFFILGNLNNKNLFLLIFGLTSLYFACSMVRLLLLLAPAFSLLAAVGVTGILRPFNALLREPVKVTVKKKHVLERVGKEFSGSAVLLVFLILMTSFAFPMPKVYRQAYAPVTVTAGSLPIVPNEPVQEWLNMLEWTRNNLKATTVVCSWWDYGYWLTILGNVTSLADNGTVNTTQIQNIGFIFMANETQALEMLKRYDAQYILVFTTLALRQSSDGQLYVISAGFGDEGKWTWMARISGKSPHASEWGWTDEGAFGEFNTTTNNWQWNERGMNSTIYKLMSYTKNRWCLEHNVVNPDADPNAYNVRVPMYFEEAYFAGLELTPSDANSKYGSLIPLVCLYKINYPSD